jgi:hypothetical protein
VQKASTAITVPPGHSFEVRAFPRGELDEGSRETFYDAYVDSYPYAAVDWDFRQFNRMIDDGHLICGAIFKRKQPIAAFGIELMKEPVLHLSFLFYAGSFHRSLFDPMFGFLWRGLQALKAGEGSDKPGAVRLVGRKGWQRMLKGRGFEIDRDGYIREDQKAVRDGFSKWLC